MALAIATAASSCGGDAEPEVTRSYVLPLRVDDSEDRYRYVADGSVDVLAGDEVTFELDNTGTLIHDLQVVDPSGNAIASAPPTAPGATVLLTVHFVEPGFYRLNCLVDDHLTAHRMQSVIEVTESSS